MFLISFGFIPLLYALHVITNSSLSLSEYLSKTPNKNKLSFLLFDSLLIIELFGNLFNKSYIPSPSSESTKTYSKIISFLNINLLLIF